MVAELVDQVLPHTKDEGFVVGLNLTADHLKSKQVRSVEDCSDF